MMPINRKMLGAAAFSLALAGGGVAGAAFGTPNLSGAQDGGSAPSAKAATHPDHMKGPRAGGLAAAAEALGMSEDDLLKELRDGKSIAQVAEAKGVDVQAVIDALVADATDRLNEMEAKLPEQMTALVNREGLPEHGPRARMRHRFAEAGLDVAAEAIGVSEDDLRGEIRDGSTIAEVATEHDVDPQKVIDALVAATTERIDQAVADGKLDADKAEEIKAKLPERFSAFVNNEHPGRGGRGPGLAPPPPPAT